MAYEARRTEVTTALNEDSEVRTLYPVGKWHGFRTAVCVLMHSNVQLLALRIIASVTCGSLDLHQDLPRYLGR